MTSSLEDVEEKVMMTDAAPQLSLGPTALDHTSHDSPEDAGGIVVWMKQFYCGLHGHDALMRFEKERLYMQCTSCGHETPGWSLSEPAPKKVLRGDARRHALRPHLVDQRRVA